ncbi:MAG: exostosin domain-containing protein [Microthrixaceae bacterium]
MTEAPITLIPGGARAVLLLRMAYAEEGLVCPPIDERIEPTALLFPRSFVEAADRFPGNKTIDYSFAGSVYRPELRAHRTWVLDFARRHFTERSHLLVSDGPEHHAPLGGFDKTGEQDVFVPKNVPEPERAFFNPTYFAVLRASQFTLCPAGDLPWSLRFFEAIMCRAIPIVEDRAHAGRNDLERGIGYTMLQPDDAHVYDEAIAEHNYRIFLRRQTLIDRDERG